MKRKADPTIVPCPKCGAPIGAVCVALGTLTGEPVGPGEFEGVHRARQAVANETAPALVKPPPPECRCMNHLGHPKAKHSSRTKAVAWAARSRRVRGMRMEPYQCPTSDTWHIRTARADQHAMEATA